MKSEIYTGDEGILFIAFLVKHFHEIMHSLTDRSISLNNSRASFIVRRCVFQSIESPMFYVTFSFSKQLRSPPATANCSTD